MLQDEHRDLFYRYRFHTLAPEVAAHILAGREHPPSCTRYRAATPAQYQDDTSDAGLAVAGELSRLLADDIIAAGLACSTAVDSDHRT